MIGGVFCDERWRNWEERRIAVYAKKILLGDAAPKPPEFSEPSGYIEGGRERWRLIHCSIAKAEQAFAAATEGRTSRQLVPV